MAGPSWSTIGLPGAQLTFLEHNRPSRSTIGFPGAQSAFLGAKSASLSGCPPAVHQKARQQQALMLAIKNVMLWSRRSCARA